MAHATPRMAHCLRDSRGLGLSPGSPERSNSEKQGCMSHFVRVDIAFVCAVLVLIALAPATSAAQPAAVAPSATLTVLTPPVQHVPAGGPSPLAATPGTNLRQGDRVITGQGGFALITFLDGSTVTVEPNSDVTVRQLDRERSAIRLLIHVGKVWARVAQLLGRESGLSLESNEYAATAHDGLIGAQDLGDGTFVCWTRAGSVALADHRGRQLVVLTPGQRATVAGIARPKIEPFSVHASVLEIVVSGAAVPLLQMPDGKRVAGFPNPDGDVNQVFGSLTAVRPGIDGGPAARLVEVPAGERGPYRLVLTGVTDGPFRVTIVGRHAGTPVWRHEETGTIQAGATAVFVIEHQVIGSDPRTARTVSGVVRTETPRTAR